MALCKRIGADRLLVDDRRARHIARLNAIPIIGSLGVLVAAKEQGLVPVIRPRIDAIRSAGIRLGERIVAEALLLAGETLSRRVLTPQLQRTTPHREIRPAAALA